MMLSIALELAGEVRGTDCSIFCQTANRLPPLTACRILEGQVGTSANKCLYALAVGRSVEPAPRG